MKCRLLFIDLFFPVLGYPTNPLTEEPMNYLKIKFKEVKRTAHAQFPPKRLKLSLKHGASLAFSAGNFYIKTGTDDKKVNESGGGRGERTKKEELQLLFSLPSAPVPALLRRRPRNCLRRRLGRAYKRQGHAPSEALCWLFLSWKPRIGVYPNN